MQSDLPERESTLVILPRSHPFVVALRGRLALVRAPEALRTRITTLVALELGRIKGNSWVFERRSVPAAIDSSATSWSITQAFNRTRRFMR
jgi:hypothetical protein